MKSRLRVSIRLPASRAPTLRHTSRRTTTPNITKSQSIIKSPRSLHNAELWQSRSASQAI
jgi:hypothetical protein